MWLIFAVLSAVFAAATSILAKAGIEGIDSTVATAIRTAIVLCMSWLMVLVSHSWNWWNFQQNLAFPCAFRNCDRRIMAVLF